MTARDEGKPGRASVYDRITFNTVPRAAAALRELERATGMNRTDVLNRAIQVYAYWEKQVAEGGTWYVDHDGELREVMIF